MVFVPHSHHHAHVTKVLWYALRGYHIVNSGRNLGHLLLVEYGASVLVLTFEHDFQRSCE
jgi:hypothetical protein